MSINRTKAGNAECVYRRDQRRNRCKDNQKKTLREYWKTLRKYWTMEHKQNIEGKKTGHLDQTGQENILRSYP